MEHPVELRCTEIYTDKSHSFAQCSLARGHRGQHIAMDGNITLAKWVTIPQHHVCDVIYDRPDTLGELELERGCKLPNPVRCNLPDGHSGSHSYTDGFGGVSWDNDPLASLSADQLETIGERMARDIDFPSVLEHKRREAAERRERIATAALVGLIARTHPGQFDLYQGAKWAVEIADVLIAELDKGK